MGTPEDVPSNWDALKIQPYIHEIIEFHGIEEKKTQLENILTLIIYIGYPHKSTDPIKNNRGTLESPAPPKIKPHISVIGGKYLERRFFSDCNT